MSPSASSTSDSRWAVVFGGPSPEHEISILTGLQAERVIAGAGQEVLPLYWAPTGGWFLVPSGTEAKDYLEGAPAGARPVDVRLGAEPGLYLKGRLRSERLEIAAALSCLHGGLGEGGGYAALMALLGIPTTGGTMYASALGMDKLAFGGVLTSAGIPTLPRVALEPDVDPPFDGPYIVKPRFGGSSIGIEIVDDVATARVVARTSAHLRAGAVVEPFRKDLDRPQHLLPHRARAGGLRPREAVAQAGRRGLLLRGEVPRRRCGRGRALLRAARAAGPGPGRGRRAGRGPRPPGGRGHRPDRHRPGGLPVRRGQRRRSSSTR